MVVLETTWEVCAHNPYRNLQTWPLTTSVYIWLVIGNTTSIQYAIPLAASYTLQAPAERPWEWYPSVQAFCPRYIPRNLAFSIWHLAPGTCDLSDFRNVNHSSIRSYHEVGWSGLRDVDGKLVLTRYIAIV